jgi:hypothetical protein
LVPDGGKLLVKDRAHSVEARAAIVERCCKLMVCEGISSYEIDDIPQFWV